MILRREPKAVVSSTWPDLDLHRAAVKKACEAAGIRPMMMEQLQDGDANAVARALRQVEDAQLYIGLFGYRYGRLPEGGQASVIEMVFDWALGREMDRLVFVIDMDHLLRFAQVEASERAQERLDLLKERARRPDNCKCQAFDSVAGLRRQVQDALQEHLAQQAQRDRLLQDAQTMRQLFDRHADEPSRTMLLNALRRRPAEDPAAPG